MTVDGPKFNWHRVQELKAGLSIKNKSHIEIQFWYSSVPASEDTAPTPKRHPGACLYFVMPQLQFDSERS